MPRWEPDARGRLERAALELFEKQGFERTSIAQITRRAGLTERSFYRHFADKREVLFVGNELLADHLVAKLETTDPDGSSLEALLLALGAADEVFPSREFLLRRARVIAANPALAERDSIKLAEITEPLQRVLENRGVAAGEARFLLDVAIAISHRAVSLWLLDLTTPLYELIGRATTELRETLGPLPPPSTGPTPNSPRVEP